MLDDDFDVENIEGNLESNLLGNIDDGNDEGGGAPSPGSVTFLFTPVTFGGVNVTFTP